MLAPADGAKCRLLAQLRSSLAHVRSPLSAAKQTSRFAVASSEARHKQTNHPLGLAGHLRRSETFGDWHDARAPKGGRVAAISLWCSTCWRGADPLVIRAISVSLPSGK